MKLSRVWWTAVALGSLILAGMVAVPAGSAPPMNWSVYYWGQYNLGGPIPAGTVAGGTATFGFSPGYVALLSTTNPGLTGDLAGQTLYASFAVTGLSDGAHFEYSGESSSSVSSCSPEPMVRFYFSSSAMSGPSYPAPGPLPTSGNPSFGLTPSAYYSHSWWSTGNNAVALCFNAGGLSLKVNLGDPSQWSDWNGQNAAESPALGASFANAVSHVSSVGLSFGGGSFYENGVTTTDGSATFILNSFTAE